MPLTASHKSNSKADEIGIAAQKVAAAAKSYGLSFEWMSSYIALISETTRETPEVVGTSLNAMLARLYKIQKTGYDSEDGATINDIAKALSRINVELFDSEGNWRSFDQILRDVGDNWGTLDAKTKSYITTTIAGTRQQNKLLVILEDLAKAQEGNSRTVELYQGALNSAGDATEKYNIWLESVAASQGNLKQAMEDMYSSVANGGLLKWFYDFTALLVETTTATNGFIPIGLALVGVIMKIVGAYKAYKTAQTALNATTSIFGFLTGGSSAMLIAGLGAVAIALTAMRAAWDKAANPEPIEFKYNTEQIDELESKIEYVSGLRDELDELAKKESLTSEELSKMNGIMNEAAQFSDTLSEKIKDTDGSFVNAKDAVAGMNEELNNYHELSKKLAATDAYTAIQEGTQFKGLFDAKLDSLQGYDLAREVQSKLGMSLSDTVGSTEKTLLENLLPYFQTRGRQEEMPSGWSIFSTAMSGRSQDVVDLQEDYAIKNKFIEEMGAERLAIIEEIFGTHIIEKYTMETINRAAELGSPLDIEVAESKYLDEFEKARNYLEQAVYTLLDSNEIEGIGRLSELRPDIQTEARSKIKEKVNEIAKSMEGQDGAALMDAVQETIPEFTGMISETYNGLALRIGETTAKNFSNAMGENMRWDDVGKNMLADYLSTYEFESQEQAQTAISNLDKFMEVYSLIGGMFDFETVQAALASFLKTGEIEKGTITRNIAKMQAVEGIRGGKGGRETSFAVADLSNKAIEKSIEEVDKLYLAFGKTELSARQLDIAIAKINEAGSIEEVTTIVLEFLTSANKVTEDLDKNTEKFMETMAGMIESMDVEESESNFFADEIAKLQEFIDEIDGSEDSIQNAKSSIIEYFAEMPPAAVQAFRKIIPELDDLLKVLDDSEAKVGDFGESLDKINARKVIRELNNTSRTLKGADKMMDAFQSSSVDGMDAVNDFTSSVLDLQVAMKAKEDLTNGSILTAEKERAAYEDIAKIVGISAEEMMDNSELAAIAFRLLDDEIMMTNEGMSILINSMVAASGLSPNMSNWNAELAGLSGDALATAETVIYLINQLMALNGATITESNGQFKVSGLSSKSRGGGRPSAGKRSGGGGGSSKKDKSEIELMLEAMTEAKEINDFMRKLIQLNGTLAESRGELTNLITLSEMELDHIRKRQPIEEQNLAILEKEIAIQRERIRGLGRLSDEYQDGRKDLEALISQHQLYTEKLKQNEIDIHNLEKAMKEYADEIRQMEIDLRETILSAIEDREALERAMLEARIDIENQIIDAITERYEKEQELILENIDLKRKALEEELSLLRKNLEERKNQANEEKKLAELRRYESDLARISADPTREKERLQLLEKINKLREEISWDNAEKEVEAREKAIEEELDLLDDYEDEINAKYEHIFKSREEIIAETNKIMAMSNEEILAWLKVNVEEFSNATQSTQLQMVQDWEETLMQMMGYIKTHWDEVEDIISKGDDHIIEFLKANSAEYRAASKLQAEAYVDAWKEQLKALEEAHKSTAQKISQINYSVPQGNAGGGSSGGGGGGGGGSSKPAQTMYQYGYKNASGQWVKGAESPNQNDAFDNTLWSAIRHWESKSGPGVLTVLGLLRKATATSPGSYMKKYKDGGLADFTGIAQLDGTPTKPELVLNPYETQDFLAMVKEFREIKFMAPKLELPSALNNRPQSITFEGGINISVDTLEDDADFEDLATRVKDAVNEMMYEEITRGQGMGGIFTRSS